MNLYRREKYLGKIRPFFHDEEMIKVIVGVRRCGKSCIMQTIAEELADDGVFGFYFAGNTDNRINYGPALENVVYHAARSKGCAVSVGRIGALECDFVLRGSREEYSYVQVAMTIADPSTEEREYAPLEKIRDNYPKYLLTMDRLLQRRNGVKHLNIVDFMAAGEDF